MRLTALQVESASQDGELLRRGRCKHGQESKKLKQQSLTEIAEAHNLRNKSPPREIPTIHQHTTNGRRRHASVRNEGNSELGICKGTVGSPEPEAEDQQEVATGEAAVETGHARADEDHGTAKAAAANNVARDGASADEETAVPVLRARSRTS